MSLWGRRNAEPYEFNDLARYNAEVARGIVHTPEWREKMAEEQRRFNEQQRKRILADPRWAGNPATGVRVLWVSPYGNGRLD